MTSCIGMKNTCDESDSSLFDYVWKHTPEEGNGGLCFTPRPSALNISQSLDACIVETDHYSHDYTAWYAEVWMEGLKACQAGLDCDETI